MTTLCLHWNRSISITVLLLLNAISWSVDPPVCKLKEFMQKNDVLLVQTAQDIGEVADNGSVKLSFVAVSSYVAGQEQQQMKGLRIDYSEKGKPSEEKDSKGIPKYETPDKYISLYLDIDELEVFSKAISTMVEIADTWKKSKGVRRSVTIQSRDDCDIEIFQYEYIETLSVSVCGYDGREYIAGYFDSPQHLLTIKGYIDKARKILLESDVPASKDTLQKKSNINSI